MWGEKNLDDAGGDLRTFPYFSKKSSSNLKKKPPYFLNRRDIIC